MSFTVEDLHDLIQLLERQPTWLTDVRRVVLTKELLALPEQLARLQQTTAHELQQLTTQLVELTVAQRDTAAHLTTLVQAQTRTEGELRELVSWQRGEAGRREGERYERDILRQAPALFNGGQGGPTDDSDVQQRLAVQLGPLLGEELLDASANPLLVDLIWWKGEEITVVEVSRQVDRQDVSRAAQRVSTLRRSGAQVTALVIGEHWATAEARDEAQSQQVEWKVGSDLSAGFLTFRKR